SELKDAGGQPLRIDPSLPIFIRHRSTGGFKLFGGLFNEIEFDFSEMRIGESGVIDVSFADHGIRGIRGFDDDATGFAGMAFFGGIAFGANDSMTAAVNTYADTYLRAPRDKFGLERYLANGQPDPASAPDAAMLGVLVPLRYSDAA